VLFQRFAVEGPPAAFGTHHEVVFALRCAGLLRFLLADGSFLGHSHHSLRLLLLQFLLRRLFPLRLLLPGLLLLGLLLPRLLLGGLLGDEDAFGEGQLGRFGGVLAVLGWGVVLEDQFELGFGLILEGELLGECGRTGVYGLRRRWDFWVGRGVPCFSVDCPRSMRPLRRRKEVRVLLKVEEGS
jgi:hypothetical protein